MPATLALALRLGIALSLLSASIGFAADAPTRPTKVVASLGYVSSTGNSEVTTLTGSDKVEHKIGKWLLVQDADALYGTNEGVENAGRYRFGLRADYGVSDRLAVYALASWRRDVFGGVARQFDEGVGLTFHALVPNPQLLDFEVGAGLLQRRDIFDQDQDFATGRAAAVYRYYFAEKTYFDAKGVYLHNFEVTDDYEWDSNLSLVAPLSNILAVKLGYIAHFRNQPPTGIEQWDRTFSAGVQATW